MKTLIQAIKTTPIIDHHAHNLLIPSEIDAYDLLSITSEAQGPALKQATSTLSHLRAVHHLAGVLECESNWDAVQIAIKQRRKEPDDAWAKECFQGIETVLIDDGLDPSNVHEYQWHDKLTRTKCKRIVRIERVAENIMIEELDMYKKRQASDDPATFVDNVMGSFVRAIDRATVDPEVAGFKSVICYRTGLAIPKHDEESRHVLLELLRSEDRKRMLRLEDERLSPLFVHLAAQVISQSEQQKPFQFHTGLGDNDIDLGLSNPAHLQKFIETYPTVPIILLHASYPFTTEAGYLASVYKNVWLDIGEVFPFLSQDGQERVVREALDLCPSEKLTWSTDGHWFPETYLLATLQVREAMQRVLCDYVTRGALTIKEAVQVVEDIFFNSSNRLYRLDIPLKSIQLTDAMKVHASENDHGWNGNLTVFKQFMEQHPSVQYIRLQWLDYTATLRVRILPISQAVKMFANRKFITITKGVLGLLQDDNMCSGFSATGVYDLYPQFQSVREGFRSGYATLQCEFREEDQKEVIMCPRTTLRKQIEKASTHNLKFLIGFEIEVVFMSKEVVDGAFQYGSTPVNDGGQSWSTTRGLHEDRIMDLLEVIHQTFERAGIELQQFHPEGAPGQYEFILGPLPPVEAVDTLLAARDIISNAATNAHVRATLYPKPFPEHPGTGAHVHMSLDPPDRWESFYAGILEHLKAIAAFTYSNEASYERVVDGAWAGSTFIAWGTQNRETPLRRIEGSHFEIKCMDGLSNPYLALAALIGAGFQGWVTEEPLTMKDCLDDPSGLSEDALDKLGIHSKFPPNLSEALMSLEKDKQMYDILGRSVVETFVNVKRMESETLSKMGPYKRRSWLIERY